MRRPLLFLLMAVTVAVAQTAARASAALRRFQGPSTQVGASRSTKRARQVVAFARRQVGVLYHWGGASRGTGFDCSGLVYAAYRSIGRTIPRSSWDQRRVGRPVRFRQLRPGDLLFTEGGGHVVLVTSKSAAISAPGEGARVRYVPLGPLRREFAGARRLLN
jgi:cell wall-associated NlpC family hydrolase